MEVTKQMTVDFTDAYLMYEDAATRMSRIRKEIDMADVLLGLEHPEAMERMAKAIKASEDMREVLQVMEHFLRQAAGIREE